MKTIHIFKGLPASGKSTLAKEWLSENPNQFKRINKDDLRAMLDNNHWSKGNEKFILKVRDQLIWQALETGFHVIVDDTNLHPKHEQQIRQLAKQFRKEKGQDVKVEVRFFEISVEECIRRDLKRNRSVGEKVIRSMHQQFLLEKADHPEQDPGLPPALIVDIDGTLAYMQNRSPFEWTKVEEDGLYAEVKEMIDRYKSDHRILIFTGRDGIAEEASKKWLQNHNVHFDEFYIRPQGNMEKDSVIKRRLYEEHVLGKYFVKFVLDDRDQVVEMWRKELGLKCLQVGYGNF